MHETLNYYSNNASNILNQPTTLKNLLQNSQESYALMIKIVENIYYQKQYMNRFSFMIDHICEF